MKVALVQMPIVWEDKPANFALVNELLTDVCFAGETGMIVLPEMFATGFTMDSHSVAEDDMGETETFLTELAKQKSAYVIAGVAKHRADNQNPSNCSVIASPAGEIICRYHKTHPFSLGAEDENYTRGNNIEVIPIEGISVSPTVCYDLRFPEVYRLAAEKNTELYVVIANWPDKRTQHWIKLLQARAIENQAYVIGVNRCGTDPSLGYDGRTMLIDYLGEIVVDAGTKACVIEAELNVEGMREWRSGFPALRDRHPSLSN